MAPSARRPNFIDNLTDDQGYGDLSCMGATAFRTPHLDRLAATGVRFTSWYSNSPVCSPARAALLTGRYPGNAGVRAILAGERTILVGNPALARRILGDSPLPSNVLPCGVDFSEQTQARLDAVAAQCEKLGYRVLRAPIVPGCDGRTYLTYLNVIIDERDGRRIVYLPVFRGAEVLNEAAERVWRSAGLDVRTIDCTSAYRHGGGLRCLVNVLQRG